MPRTEDDPELIIVRALEALNKEIRTIIANHLIQIAHRKQRVPIGRSDLPDFRSGLKKFDLDKRDAR